MTAKAKRKCWSCQKPGMNDGDKCGCGHFVCVTCANRYGHEAGREHGRKPRQPELGWRICRRLKQDEEAMMTSKAEQERLAKAKKIIEGFTREEMKRLGQWIDSLPDPEKDTCDAVSPGRAYRCALSPGHRGQHKKGGAGWNRE